MILALQIKLLPTKEQHQLLLETMKRFNEACNEIAEVAYANRTANKIRLQQLIYYHIRQKYGLSAQMTILAVRKVAEAYKRDRTIKPYFDLYSAMVHDVRTHSFKGIDRVSILTLKGRQIVSIVMGSYQKRIAGYIRGQSDLLLRKGVFYLMANIELPESAAIEAKSTLGIDFGLKYITYDSDGVNYSGKSVEQKRSEIAKLAANLQSCGTKSAKRHLKKLAGKMKRFRKNVNHEISKRLVAKAKDTQRRIALEDLRGIRGVTVRRNQRSRLDSWGFFQLRTFIEYKAKIAGVHVIAVPPRGTSHICPECGIESRKNRPVRDLFQCIGCGYAGPADHIAAINIAARADVMQPIVSSLEHFVSPQEQTYVL
jgi:IS605 OrfB family transposase